MTVIRPINQRPADRADGEPTFGKSIKADPMMVPKDCPTICLAP